MAHYVTHSHMLTHTKSDVGGSNRERVESASGWFIILTRLIDLFLPFFAAVHLCVIATGNVAV